MSNLFKKKVALYCCMSNCNSTTSNSDLTELQRQKDAMTSFVKRNGWTIYDFYIDYSKPQQYNSEATEFSSDFDRPEFRHLYQDAEAHLFDIVVCDSRSSFSSTPELTSKIIETDFPKWGVRFIGLSDLTSDNSNNKMQTDNTYNLLLHSSLIEDWFLDEMSDQINMVSATSAHELSGKKHTVPFGYTTSTTHDHHIMIDKPSAKIVRFIFHTFSEGLSISEIAACLRNTHIPTPTALQSEDMNHGAASQNTYWHEYMILYILQNKIYHGESSDSSYDNVSIPPIISDALWRCVQNQLDNVALNACCI